VLERVQGQRILDIGFVGKQGFLHTLIREKSPASLVIPLDLDTGLVKQLGFKNSVAADALRLPFPDNRFDTVVIAEVIEHVESPFLLLKEIHRVLKEGGKIIITTPSGWNLYKLFRNWLLVFRPFTPKNVVNYMWEGDDRKLEDHVFFFDPLTLCNVLRKVGFEPAGITTTGFILPIPLPSNNLLALQWDFYPFNRLSSTILAMAVKARRPTS